MNEPLVSCLCVTEGREPFMDWLLWTFERQTYENKELVIVDSSQQPWNCEHPQVRVVPMAKGTNVPAKRNRALDEAAGEYIAWFDDDDWQHPERLSRWVRRLEAQPTVGYGGPTRSFFLDLYSRAARTYDGAGSLIFNGSLFRTELARKIRFDERCAKASDTPWLREVRRALGRPLMERDEVLTFWLSHDENISNPRQRRRFPVSLPEVAASIGLAGWADTSERLETLLGKLPESTHETVPRSEESARRSSLRVRALARRGGQEGASWSLQHPPAEGPRALVRSAEEQRKPIEVPPLLELDLVFLDPTGSDGAPWRSSVEERWRREVERVTRCRIRSILRPTSLVELTEAAADRREEPLLLAKGWFFLQRKTDLLLIDSMRHLRRGTVSWIGLTSLPPVRNPLGERAALGSNARPDRETELFFHVQAPTPLWLTLGASLHRWCESIASFDELRSQCPPGIVGHVGPRRATCHSTNQPLDEEDISLLSDLCQRPGALRWTEHEFASPEFMARLRRRMIHRVA